MGESLERAIGELERGDREAASEDADELHRVILAVGGTPRIRRIVGNMREPTGRLHELALSLPGRLERSLEEHARVLEAMRRRDGEEAERRIREHIASAEADVLTGYQNRGVVGGDLMTGAAAPGPMTFATTEENHEQNTTKGS